MNINICFLVICSMLIYCCKSHIDSSNLIGEWQGEYDDYKYHLIIEEDLNYHLIKHEVNQREEQGSIVIDRDLYKIKRIDQWFLLKFDAIDNTLKILPTEISKDIEVLSLVTFSRKL